jgi:hypothetical protein
MAVPSSEITMGCTSPLAEYSPVSKIILNVASNSVCCHTTLIRSMPWTPPRAPGSVPDSISSTSAQATDATDPSSVHSTSGHILCPHPQDRLLQQSFPALSSSETHPEGLSSHWLSHNQTSHGLRCPSIHRLSLPPRLHCPSPGRHRSQGCLARRATTFPLRLDHD